MTLRIGIGLFTGQLPEGCGRTFAQEYREMLDLVRLAEDAGFDSAWVSEHHGSSDGYLPSLLVMLAAMAEVTSRMQLGTGVILTPLHDPIRLAEDAAVVDQLSEGRLTLGLGLGWREEEFRMLRVPFQERLARHVETVQILRQAFTGRRFSFEGKVFKLDRVRVTPPPFRPGGPPILLGGYVDEAMVRAGTVGDGHITDAFETEQVRRAVQLMDEGAKGAGRDPSKLRLTLMQNVFVSADGGAWEQVRAGVLHQWGSYTSWDEGHDTPEHDLLEPDPAVEEEARRATIAGRPEEVAEALRPLVDAYADRELELIVRLHYPGMGFDAAGRAVALFGQKVLPALRR